MIAFRGLQLAVVVVELAVVAMTVVVVVEVE